MTDKLSLYNGALRNLGQRSLTSLSENREPRRMLDEVWDDGAINLILQEGWWKFASRTVQLSFNPSYTRQFGYSYQFTKPADYVRLGAFCSDQYLRGTIDDYLDEGGAWYADINPIWVQYVSNDPAYGNDFSKWPPTFNQFAQGMLAQLASARFKKTPAEKKDIDKLVEDLKHDALSKDAAEGPVKKMRAGSWSRARMGGGFPQDRLRGGRLIG